MGVLKIGILKKLFENASFEILNFEELFENYLKIKVLKII